MIKLEKFNDEDEVEYYLVLIFFKNEIDDWLLNTSYKCPICREGVGDYITKFNNIEILYI